MLTARRGRSEALDTSPVFPESAIRRRGYRSGASGQARWCLHPRRRSSTGTRARRRRRPMGRADGLGHALGGPSPHGGDGIENKHPGQRHGRRHHHRVHQHRQGHEQLLSRMDRSQGHTREHETGMRGVREAVRQANGPASAPTSSGVPPALGHVLSRTLECHAGQQSPSRPMPVATPQTLRVGQALRDRPEDRRTVPRS